MTFTEALGAKTKKDQTWPLRDNYASQISNSVYQATDMIEAMEQMGLLDGNGHHMRQQVAEFAEQLVRDRWISRPATEDGEPMSETIDRS